MIDEVPEEYLFRGQVKFYQLNNYAALGKWYTSYGCCRHKQTKSKSPPKPSVAGKFRIGHSDHRVQASDEEAHNWRWPQTIKKYLNNALVEKGHRGLLTCLGVTNKSINKESSIELTNNNPQKKKKPKPQGMSACECA
jgi:hypothetical protein